MTKDRKSVRTAPLLVALCSYSFHSKKSNKYDAQHFHTVHRKPFSKLSQVRQRQKKPNPGRSAQGLSAGESALCFQQVSPFKKVTCSYATRRKGKVVVGVGGGGGVLGCRRGFSCSSENLLRQGEYHLSSVNECIE